MIRHIVLYRLKDNSAESAAKLKDRFLSMRGKIPQLKSIWAGQNIVVSDRSFDFALVCDFDSVAALDEYQVHPVHVEVRDFVRTQISASHSADFEF